MNPIENMMHLEKHMTTQGYWYTDTRKDFRLLVLALANQGTIYVEAMDTEKSLLLIRTKHGRPLCYLERKEATKPKRGKSKM